MRSEKTSAWRKNTVESGRRGCDGRLKSSEVANAIGPTKPRNLIDMQAQNVVDGEKLQVLERNGHLASLWKVRS